MGSYTESQLESVKALELSIFKDFAKVCEENGLKYWGIGGTGIGAVRHKGFIPWDDDIDVGMTYDDYVKLNETFKKEYADKYTVVNGESFGEYPALNEHIVMNGTKFVTKDAKHLKYPQGIFLDVFPFFKSPADDKLRIKHGKSMWLWGKILFLRQIPFPTIPFKGAFGKVVHFGTFCCSYLLKLVLSQKRIYNISLKKCLKYNDLKDDYVYIFTSSPTYLDYYFDKNVRDNLVKYPFEDTEMLFPADLDGYLTKHYSNYMQLPPKEKRINHAPYILEFPKDSADKENDNENVDNYTCV